MFTAQHLQPCNSSEVRKTAKALLEFGADPDLEMGAYYNFERRLLKSPRQLARQYERIPAVRKLASNHPGIKIKAGKTSQ